MTTNSYKFGNGRLILGDGPLNVTAQMRAVSIDTSENVQTIDAIPVLDDTEIPEEEEATYKRTLSGQFLQDLTLAGVIDWSWENEGTEQPFVFVPDLVIDRGFEGVLVPVGLKVGGEVTKPKNRPVSDFTWRIIGKPQFGTYDSVDDEVDEDV